MNAKRLRIIVCGSTFGQFYLEALAQLKDVFDVVGLLSKGSERSVKCAAQYDVPVYTSFEALPDDIDIACVVLRSAVMGGNGTDLSLKFIEKGIHVIQEHPVHHKDMATCLKAANKHKVFFKTGDLYVHLPEVRRFIACAKAIQEKQPITYIDAAYASQVSYPLMHILNEILPQTRPWEINEVVKDKGPFQFLSGTLGKIPITLRVHNEINPEDPDNHLHLLHTITLGTEGGSLALVDTHGPVTWHPKLHVPDNLSTMGELAETTAPFLLENSIETLGNYRPKMYTEILTEEWPAAIGQDLLQLRECVLKMRNDYHLVAQKDLLVARQWQDLTAAFGYPVLKPNLHHQPLSLEVLKKVALEIT